MALLTPVRIEWIDSGENRSDKWHPRDWYLENFSGYAVSVGFLMHEDPEYVLIAQSYDEANDMWFSVQRIWRPAVVKMEPLLAVSFPEPRDDD